MDTKDSSKEGNFSFKSLKEVREKMLDLTSRNSLLNYRYRKASSIRIIDEFPDQVANVLKDGRSMSFLPLDEPTEEELIDGGYLELDPASGDVIKNNSPTPGEWAKYKGFNPSYDLPEEDAEKNDYHQDTNLQTILYPSALEATLRSMRRNSVSAIDEMGANILYFAIGFLEWYESEDSDEVRLAPLFTLPVQIERSSKPTRTGVFRYNIKLKDDGIITNQTLKQKIFYDFNYSLPPITNESNPEEYFKEISKTFLKQQPRWKLRRQCSLVLLNFTKQVMYEDLKPESWPSSTPIEEHPIVAHLFGSATLEPENTITQPQDYSIDEISNIHVEFPLIYDADTSQHSALIDAVKGQNLVIIGPPGSGKSQTITNLVAALIANEKRVLFVAEKMAALDVVKDRLDKAGLGEFCLELHSHKTSKQKMLHDLDARIKKHRNFHAPRDVQADIELFEEYKTRLNEYSLLINREWKNTGFTIHEIFMKATRYRGQVSIDTGSIKIDNITGETWTPLKHKKLLDKTDIFKEVYGQIYSQVDNGDISKHYWYGINDTNISFGTSKQLIKALEDWNLQLITIYEFWLILTQESNSTAFGGGSFSTIKRLNYALKLLPKPLGSEPFTLIPEITPDLPNALRWIGDYEQIQAANINLEKMIRPDRILDPTTPKQLAYAFSTLQGIGVNKGIMLSSLDDFVNANKIIIDRINDLDNHFRSIRKKIPDSIKGCFDITYEGLSEFVCLVDLIEYLPPNLWYQRSEIYDNPLLDPALDQMTGLLKKAIPLHNDLKETFNLHRIPELSELKWHYSVYTEGGFLRWFSSGWCNSRKALLELSVSPTSNEELIISLLPALIRYLEVVEEMETLNKNTPYLKGFYCGVDTPIEHVNSMRKWYKAVRNEYGIGFSERAQIGNWLISMDRSLALGILADKSRNLRDQAVLIIESIDTLANIFVGSNIHLDPLTPLIDKIRLLLDESEKALDIFGKIINGVDHRIEDLINVVEKISLQQNQSTQWCVDPLTKKFSAVDLDFFVTSGANEKPAAVLKNLLSMATIIAEEPVLDTFFRSNPGESKYQDIKKISESLEKSITSVEPARKLFMSLGNTNEDNWLTSSSDKLKPTIDRNKKAIDNSPWLETWLNYTKAKAKLNNVGLDDVISLVESNALSTQGLTDVLNLVVYERLSQEIFTENKPLANFIGMEQVAIRKKFQGYDRKLMDLQRELVAYKADQITVPRGVSGGRVKDLTELALIEHNISLQRRKITIRELLKKAGRCIQTLKPCFMMSPMSVAQYLTPGQFEFDVVIMDEASQIRPADALGAIARCKKMVVVGDPKQLPPTNFFQKVVSDDDDPDEFVIQQTDSILETLEPIFKKRLLRWHYRSQHESLIDFSNQKFYDGELVIFPSPFQSSDEFGIKYTRVPKGRFIRGKSRNIEEAKKVALAAADQLMQYPKDSVGIVAMNVNQRDEIEMQLEQLIKDRPELQDLFEKNNESQYPIFVKNLENVQGDERDVIIISMTYGPDTVGANSMDQRFGPINSDVGWRRLNVLFTRSKKRMLVFSSMDSGLIRPTSSSRRGVNALKSWLEYCETKTIPHHEYIPSSGRSFESDFEISVARSLGNYGYQCEPQLGVAGYYLDLAVRDPGMPGRFLLGIECDGATYHSAKSARERDRLRQEILERQGWKIRRIWSTDYIQNPEAQIRPILKELDSLKTEITESVDSEVGSTDISTVQPPSEDIDIDEKGTEQLDLRAKLEKFDREIIRREFPDTDKGSRLLRPSMLDALLEYLPYSKADFLNEIPGYLREKTSAKEGRRFLEQVLDLISEDD